MRNHFFLTVFFLFAVNILISSINFKSSKDWKIIQKESSKLPLAEFKNNQLFINNGTSGYVRTSQKVSEFDLSVEWKWVNKLGNSGVLIHIQDVDAVWPACFQSQLKADAAGDIICMNGVNAIECQDTLKFTIPKIRISNELGLGEWNHMRILCKNKIMEVFVNGVLQNKITGMTVNQGYIGFQAEGQAVIFRKLKLKK